MLDLGSELVVEPLDKSLSLCPKKNLEVSHQFWSCRVVSDAYAHNVLKNFLERLRTDEFLVNVNELHLAGIFELRVFV